ncbi:MAG TPA: hypothetical protein VFU03_03985 [Gemmatimonadales bacterium]|nr:hypothetical protein [Gemmatimonadales bacterium]
MLIGFNVEGHDHLILRCLIERILGLDPAAVRSEHVEQPGGWNDVLQVAPLALKKFYALSADLAVIGVDNDGDEDLMGGASEDPKHPRHWNHAGTSSPQCRQCQLHEIADRTRGQLGWWKEGPRKHGRSSSLCR